MCRQFTRSCRIASCSSFEKYEYHRHVSCIGSAFMLKSGSIPCCICLSDSRRKNIPFAQMANQTSKKMRASEQKSLEKNTKFAVVGQDPTGVVFSFLDPFSLLHCSQTCKQLKKFVDAKPNIWETMRRRLWALMHDLPEVRLRVSCWCIFLSSGQGAFTFSAALGFRA